MIGRRVVKVDKDQKVTQIVRKMKNLVTFLFNYSRSYLSKIKFSPQRRRGRREDKFLFVPGQPEQTKSSQPLAGHLLAEGLALMENRYLPILHKESPSAISASLR